ncbi:MAG TPA: hypothetical protein VGM03_16935, partial [Phycisphaerae bacterium]
WAPISIVAHKVPGWGETYSFIDLDGTPANRGWLIAVREDRPIFQEPYVAELHVYPIRNGKAKLPSRIPWRVIWANLGRVSMGASPLITTHTFVLADGIDPAGSGPGQWYMGEKRSAIRGPTSYTCQFRPTGEQPSYGRLPELLRDAPRAQFGMNGGACHFVKQTVDRVAMRTEPRASGASP